MTCRTCDKPHATAAQVAHKDGCTCAECLAVCWSQWGVVRQPADWRGRALAAERERDDLRRRIAALVNATKSTNTDGGTKS